jgi:IS4 transposase
MRLKKEAKKKGRIPSAQSLALADWTVMITNVPEKWIPFEMLWRIYAIRWQIELLFKQLKSVLQVHHSNTGNVCRLKCETYGKLIMATLISRIHGAINAELWNTNKRELSMDKFYKRIQERAFHLLELLLTSVSKAVNYLKKEVRCVIKNCMKCRQPSRMTTLQSLEENIFLIVEDLKVYA